MGGGAVVLGQSALRAGAEQESAIGAGNQASDGSLVTPAPHRMPTALTLSCNIPDLPQLGPAESPRVAEGRHFLQTALLCPTQPPTHPWEPHKLPP